MNGGEKSRMYEVLKTTGSIYVHQADAAKFTRFLQLNGISYQKKEEPAACFINFTKEVPKP